jgi:hypothetical protein
MKHITPSADDLGQRLDRYMRKIFPCAKLGEIYEALRTKKITLAREKTPRKYKTPSWWYPPYRYRGPDIIKIWEQPPW